MWSKSITGLALILLISGCSQQTIKSERQDAATKPQPVLSTVDKADYQKALQYIKKKQYAKAEKKLDKLLEKYPDAAGILANKGVIYSRQNKLDEAEKLLLLALEQNDKLVQARNYLAVVYRKQGKFSLAKEMLEIAIATDPYYKNAYYNLGILYELYLQVPEKALENYQLYLDLKQDGDKNVSQWISLLKRQLKAAKK